jgi:ribosomal protein S12 methylthiotransferase accessory factor YcaO
MVDDADTRHGRTLAGVPEQLERDVIADASPAGLAEPPPVDPTAVARAYRTHRARRRARKEHIRRTRYAGLRFWVVLLALLAGVGVIAVVLSQQIEQLFGL